MIARCTKGETNARKTERGRKNSDCEPLTRTTYVLASEKLGNKPHRTMLGGGAHKQPQEYRRIPTPFSCCEMATTTRPAKLAIEKCCTHSQHDVASFPQEASHRNSAMLVGCWNGGEIVESGGVLLRSSQMTQGRPDNRSIGIGRRLDVAQLEAGETASAAPVNLCVRLTQGIVNRIVKERERIQCPIGHIRTKQYITSSLDIAEPVGSSQKHYHCADKDSAEKVNWHADVGQGPQQERACRISMQKKRKLTHLSGISTGASKLHMYSRMHTQLDTTRIHIATSERPM